MNKSYTGKNDIPRWMTQQTPSIGEANSDRVKVVTPEDLQTASQMYGQLSDRMFGLANQVANQLNYIDKDYASVKSSEAYAQGLEAVEKLRLDPEASKDGPSFRKAAQPILDEVTKGMGTLEASVAKKLVNSEIVKTSLDISQRQVNEASAMIVKQQHSSWDSKQKAYLSQVNGSWTPEQQQEFKTKVQQDRRLSIKGMSEDQYKIQDEEFQKDLDAAAMVNPLFKKNANGVEAFRIPGERHKILESESFKTIADDPEKYDRVLKLLGNGAKLATTEAQFQDQMADYAVESNYVDFRSTYDKIQDPVKKAEFYKQEKNKSKLYDIKYQKKLKDFGKQNQLEQVATRYGASKASNDSFYRKGVNQEYELSDMMTLASNGKITRSQLNAYQAGTKLRSKAYDTYDKSFDSQVKAEFGISMKMAKGKNAAFAEQFMPKNPSDLEIKSYILEQKAALAGLPDDQYQKGLNDILVKAKQKRLEIDQKKQAVYGNKKPSEILTQSYGSKR